MNEIIKSELKIIQTHLDANPKEWSLIWSLIIVLVVSLVSIFNLNINTAQDVNFLTANFNLVFVKNEIYRLWSTLFVHADLKHLTSNMFFAFILYYYLLAYYNSKFIIISSLLVGGLVNSIVLIRLLPDTVLLGFSGVVYYLGALWLTLFVLIDVKKSFRGRLLRVLGVSFLLFFPTEVFNNQISYYAHFLGFVFGIVIALFYYIKNINFFKSKIVSVIELN